MITCLILIVKFHREGLQQCGFASAQIAGKLAQMRTQPWRGGGKNMDQQAVTDICRQRVFPIR